MTHLRGFSLSVLLALLLTGCWDLTDIDQRRFITAIGIDREPEERLIVSAQIVVPPHQLPPGELGGAPDKTFFFTQTTADSTRMGLDLIKSELFGQATVVHTQMVVLGEELVRTTDVVSVVDYFLRDPLFPPVSNVLVAHEHTAAEVLQFQPTSTILPARGVAKSAQTLTQYDRTYFIPIWQFRARIANVGMDTYAPLIRLNEEDQTFITAGLAAFAGERMSYLLSPEEAEMFGLLTGFMRAGSLSFRLSDGEVISLKTVRGVPRMRVERDGPLPTFHVSTTMTAMLAELTDSEVTLTPEVVRELERELESLLQPRLEDLLHALKQHGTDIVGLGEQLRVQAPDLWRELNWKEIYGQVPIEVSVTVQIKRTGALR